ncbi:MAG TPA: single-stranded DNA-binding protein [Erysipelothrix sp.]|nr:single-stranded DNA-binding protein [Erysipelothrix sp.]
MVNRTVLVGRLTRDPELRKTATGKSVLSFSVAINRQFNKDQTDFVNCVAWEQTADFMSTYLTKGSLISVEGRIQSGSYEDTTGKKVYTQDVVAERVQALESRAQREQARPVAFEQSYQASPSPAPTYSNDDEPVLDITSDDLPF